MRAQFFESAADRKARCKAYWEKSRRLHHDEILRRYRDGLPKVGTRVLGRVRQNPHYEERQGIQHYVVCRTCGTKRGTLPNHILRFHRLTTLEYRGQFPDAPLVCTAIRKKTSVDQKRLKKKLH